MKLLVFFALALSSACSQVGTAGLQSDDASAAQDASRAKTVDAASPDLMLDATAAEPVALEVSAESATPLDGPSLPADCDVVGTASCPAGYACLFPDGCLHPWRCVPWAGTIPAGGHCDPHGDGSECAPGTRCFVDVCVQFCRSSVDCSAGTTCAELVGCAGDPALKLCR